MKSIALSLSFALTVFTARSQTKSIDSNTYYEHFSYGVGLQSKHIHTDWLKYSDIVPIVSDELRNANCADVYENQLYLLPSKQAILLAAYCYDGDFGFAYSEGHAAFPKKEHRLRRSNSYENSGFDFIQSYYGPKRKLGSYQIKNLPINIIIIQEDCYWFQYTDNPVDNENLVTRSVVVEILRQDIRAKIKFIKNLKG